MTMITELNRTDFDYVIVGGGTAGCVIASRLAETLPDHTILMIEAGPSDLDDKQILDLRNMYNLMGSQFDYSYRSTDQPRGKLTRSTSQGAIDPRLTRMPSRK